MAYDQLPFRGTGKAYDYQYNTQFDPQEYDQNTMPTRILQPGADQDGNRPESLVEEVEVETVEHRRSWRPENSGSRPPREAAKTVPVEQPSGVGNDILVVTTTTAPPLAENGQGAA